MKISHMIGAALFFLFFIGCEKQHTEYSIEEFMNTLSVRGSSFSNDERSILFSSDKTGIFNAYVVGIQSGQISQLTNSDTNSIFTISFFPNDNRILYRSDQGGNELYHIFVRNTDGSVRDLTQGIRERAMFYGWAHDEKSFYYGSNRRDPRYMDVYEMDINTFNQKLIFNNNDGYSFGSVSNDERFLSLEKTHTRYDSDIYLYHIGTGELQHISSHDGDVNHEPLDFTVDSKGLHYLTDLNSEFKYQAKQQQFTKKIGISGIVILHIQAGIGWMVSMLTHRLRSGSPTLRTKKYCDYQDYLREIFHLSIYQRVRKKLPSIIAVQDHRQISMSWILVQKIIRD